MSSSTATSEGTGDAGSILSEQNLRLLSAIQFDGFDPEKFREEVKSTTNITFNDLVLILGTYATVGNNLARLTDDRVMDPKEARKVSNVLLSAGIRAGDKKFNLPRFAHAYAPVLLLVRSAMLKKGVLRKPQVATSSSVEYCDLAFNGIYPQARDYCLQMGRIITRVSEPKLTDAECDSRTIAFAAIAAEGLSSDLPMKANLVLKDLKAAQFFAGLKA